MNGDVRSCADGMMTAPIDSNLKRGILRSSVTRLLERTPSNVDALPIPVGIACVDGCQQARQVGHFNRPCRCKCYCCRRSLSLHFPVYSTEHHPGIAIASDLRSISMALYMVLLPLQASVFDAIRTRGNAGRRLALSVAGNQEKSDHQAPSKQNIGLIFGLICLLMP